MELKEAINILKDISDNGKNTLNFEFECNQEIFKNIDAIDTVLEEIEKQKNTNEERPAKLALELTKIYANNCKYYREHIMNTYEYFLGECRKLGG